MFGLFNRNPEAGAPGQPQNVFLTQKFIAYSLMSYTAAAWSLHYCVTTSFSYLHAMTKITEGIHAMIWGNLFLLNSVLILKGVIHMLFGQLRLIEYEHILERISYTVITLLLSCSSMNGLISVMQIHCVLFVCCRTLHWILKDRMEVTFQANDMRLTLKDILLSRFMFNLLVLTAVDGIIVAYYVNKILYKSNIDVTYTPVSYTHLDVYKRQWPFFVIDNRLIDVMIRIATNSCSVLNSRKLKQIEPST